MGVILQYLGAFRPNTKTRHLPLLSAKHYTSPQNYTIYDTIWYDTIYLRALKSWQNGQLSLAHGKQKIKKTIAKDGMQ